MQDKSGIQDKSGSCLTDWIIAFLENRDLPAKKIEGIEKNRNGFDVYVKFKDKEQFFVVMPIIRDIDAILAKFDGERKFGLVVFNTRSNLDALVQNWDKFVGFKHLCIYFVNPFSQSEQKWVIYPCTHNNICERSTLEKGLNSMFEMVEPLSPEQITLKAAGCKAPLSCSP